MVNGAVASANETVGNAFNGAKEQMGVAYGRAQVVGVNASESAKSGSDLAKEQAGHLLGNAQEMVGGRMEEVGKSIKLANGDAKNE